MISPPDFANGFELLSVRISVLVDGSYDGVKLTGFSVVTGFFLMRFVVVA